MKITLSPASRALALVFAGVLASSPALADKPSHAGGGDKGNQGQKHEKDDDRGGARGHKFERNEASHDQRGRKFERNEASHDQRGRDHEVRTERGKDRQVVAARDTDRHAAARQPFFTPQHHTTVHQHFDGEFRAGNCPPGLAKKNNGCMPPGQAKQLSWTMGRPLAPGVVTYQVPAPLLVQLGTPPAGHRYVRVGNDILLLSPGTALVVDVIRNLGRA